MNRQERRALARKADQLNKIKEAGISIDSLNLDAGYGIGNSKNRPASGQNPHVNPFMIPKATGLNVISNTFPSNYYVEWNLGTWRQACDQAMKMGYPISYAALTSWTFECSAFVQSLFREVEVAVSKIPVYLMDENGNVNEAWSKELCEKKWFRDLIKEAIFSNFWGFSAINFDPINQKIYKYPMQDVDPINRFIRESTYNLYNGTHIAENMNLLFFQPSTSYESFLGWMQPITRSFIQMNVNNNSWVAAGKKLAFPLLTIGYPQNDNSKDVDGNLVNNFKQQADLIAANITPEKAMTYPYTVDAAGNIQKAIEIDFKDSGTSKGAHQIFVDFNAEQKNDIREMILLSTLTSSVGSKGSLALGEIHMEKYESAINYTVDCAISMLNDEFLSKIGIFYKNFPKNCKLGINKAKQWDLDEVVKISTVLNQNNLNLTPEFFEQMGLSVEYIQEKPEPELPEKAPEKEEKKGIFGKKKSQPN
jgi:hypothetical protein